MKRVYMLYDKSSGGYLAIKDLPLVMRILGQSPTEAQIRDIIKEYDCDETGILSFMNFLDFWSKNHEKMRLGKSQKKQPISRADTFKYLDKKS